MKAPADATRTTGPSRTGLWVQLLIGWMPAWALFTLMMMAAHDMPWRDSAMHAARLVAIAALLGLLVVRGTARWPWPHPWRWRFLAGHLLAAPVYSGAWQLCNNLIESALRGQLVLIRGPGFTAFAVTGIWLYVMVAGVAYAQQAARAAAEAQALQARTRLAALRAQLHPHFLFNALHTVVQLIPLNPQAASQATEQLAALLRSTLDNDSDVLSLRDEWAMVRRYLAIEQLRLGQRLELHVDLAEAAMHMRLPSFALQTLVENAVHHAAEVNVGITSLRITAQRDGATLVVSVADNGPGAALGTSGDGPSGRGDTRSGGLQRLRERLDGLFGRGATLTIHSAPGLGFSATLHVLQQTRADD